MIVCLGVAVFAPEITAQSPVPHLDAQVFDLNKDREPMMVLDGLWHFHPGDDPHWADPNFDDSKWPLISSTRTWDAQGYKGMSGVAWYRTKVLPPDTRTPLALYVPEIRTSYQVFADGQFVGGLGGMPPASQADSTVRKVFSLPLSADAGRHEIVLAIRVWQWPVMTSYAGGGLRSGIRIGDAQLIGSYGASQDLNLAWTTVGDTIINTLEILACLAALSLFAFRRQETEFLWFGVYVCFNAVSRMFHDFSWFHSTSLMWRNFVQNVPLGTVATLAQIAFFFRVLKGRKDWLFWSAVGSTLLVALFDTLDPLTNYAYVGGATANLIGALSDLPIAAWILAILVRRIVEGLPDARLLFMPVLLQMIARILLTLSYAGLMAGWWSARFLNWLLYTWQEPIPLSVMALIQALFLVSVLAILIHRFVRSQQSEERLASEVQAAREIQRVLIPVQPESAHGISIDAAFLPAREVGGDFYRCRVLPDGSQWVLIGDVSGKGTAAGITGAMLLGAAEGHESDPPAKQLSRLNQALCNSGVGGFATCLVLHISRDAVVTAANAGHLAPYRNGEEMELDSGLPLGVTSEATYSETRFQLDDGDRLTLLSDGVVEARDPSGELFGFSRTRDVSGLSAEKIANAAQGFGQNDDITVLTLSFSPAEVAHA